MPLQTNTPFGRVPVRERAFSRAKGPWPPCNTTAGRLWYFIPTMTTELQDFRKWLRRRGRTQGTANAYAYQISRGIDLDRLVDEDAAPKYLHSIRAAYKSYAKFMKDDELMDELEEIALPPALRTREKSILTKDQWRDLIDEIDEADYISEPTRAALGMMACRGFRKGDVLRLRKEDVARGLSEGVLTYKAKGRRLLQFPVNDHWGPYLEILNQFKFQHVAEIVSPRADLESAHDSAASSVARSLSGCAEEIGVDDIHPHLLRKTYATLYYQKCKDPEKLRAHMQWASIQTAMLYVAKSDQKELEAVADSLFQ